MSQEMLDRILNAVVDLKINMDRKFEQVDERFDKVDIRFDSIEGRLTSAETSLDSMERQINRVALRLDRVEGELGHIRTAVLETGRAVKGHEERIVAMEGRD